jgi:cellulose synthase/poly-beta-1,6-N-acetylglucosamine synthase-like glycosyltransferase
MPQSLSYVNVPGIKIAKGELIAVVDADSYPSQDSLKKMVGYFEEDSNVAAVTSRVLVKNRKNFIERYQDLDYRVIAWSRKIMDFYKLCLCYKWAPKCL